MADDADANKKHDQLVPLHQPQEPTWLSVVKEEGLDGARRLLKKAPLVNVYFEVIESAARRAQAREIENFFRLVAQHSTGGDEASLLVDLAEGLDKPHVYQAVTNGYDAMRKCADESIKGALAVLVAQQMYRSDLTARYFRSAASLLEECDIHASQALLMVTGAVSDFQSEWTESDWSPYVGMSQQKLDDSPDRAFWVASRQGEPKEQKTHCGSVRRLPIPSCSVVEHLLDKHGFAEPIGALTSSAMNGDIIGAIWFLLRPDQLKWYSALHECLLAIPQEAAST